MSRTIMTIDAHCADMEMSCGPALAQLAAAGDTIHLLHLTPGERGHRTKDQDEYAAQKRAEAEEAARRLGGTTTVFEYRDAELPSDKETAMRVADEIRRVKPQIIITHPERSLHKDHEAAHRLTMDAVLYAVLPGIKRESPAHGGCSIYFAENWEDTDAFQPFIYLKITEESYRAGLEVADAYELFRGGISTFAYRDYYTSLWRSNGALGGAPYACRFDVPPFGRRKVVETL